MKKEYVLQQIEKVDLLDGLDPKEVSTNAKLNWVKRLIFIAVWPLVKPWVLKHVNEKFAEAIETILEGI